MEYLLVGRWILAFAILAVLGYPIGARLFSRFSTGGAGFAPIVGVTVVTIVAYWIGQIAFGWWTLWIGLAVLVALSAASTMDLDRLRAGDLSVDDDLPFNRRGAADAAVVFAAAFLLVIAIRSADPAVNPIGGEKFLDYGLLRTLLRAETLPPPDMWFAGEPLQYYYGGHLAATLLSGLTATPPQYAYNLALAGFYAMLVTAAFDLAGNVASERGLSRRRAGAFAAVFVGLAANLLTATQLLAGWLPEGIRRRVAELVAARAEPEAADLLAGVDGFSYWTASRVIPGTINEFPLFAWLNGDLHAHMMGGSFLLLAVAVAFAYWQTPAERLRRRRLLVFVVLPILGGFQIPTDTWSFPTIFGVAWLALAFAPARPLLLLPGGERIETVLRSVAGGDTTTDAPSGWEKKPLSTELCRTGGALVVAALSGAVGFVLGASFLLGASAGQTVAILEAADRSGLGALMVVHGAFLAAFLAFLFGTLGSGGRGALAVAVAFGAVSGVLFEFAALVVVAPLLVGGWIAFRLEREVGFETVLLVGGAGLVTIVELVYVAEEAGPGRLNTVFKTYFQVWVLWGVAMGPVLSDLFEPPERDRIADWWPSPDTRRFAGRAFVGLLVLTTLPYAALALDAHFDRHDAGTLDATAFLERDHPEEAPAIEWIDDNADAEATAIDREPTLLEAPGAYSSPSGLAATPSEPGMYAWNANPASSLTGIPTVAGWQHQIGYRGGDTYWSRANAVDRAYAGEEADRVAVLEEYGVTHVWVGPGERDRYGEVSFEQFDGVELAFETETVRIYRVDPAEVTT
ncbi:Oligosaccharyl transferase, PMT/STT3 family [Halalkaliarchaeum sp. AArc-CO]|uniref:DUF2298 domain-containing protein n=1 Tax=Halalkaliarchaeum sp. AArc-CO TaxID=2866381 RepID=UPI00217E593A|nr:DUF2298 domain-containing protein [Halalkaliarchaeum sp. AArc-CO]UWG51019.1 Oligosaccharyl transferase, PMT/STT3 family [Halalkaliarchaeum sp. AArc-CO]